MNIPLSNQYLRFAQENWPMRIVEKASHRDGAEPAAAPAIIVGIPWKKPKDGRVKLLSLVDARNENFLTTKKLAF